MAIIEAVDQPTVLVASRRTAVARTGPPRDLQRTFQLVLATIWLLDAVLQIQPFMFTRGSDGFSGMLNGLASGNPSWVAHSITWNGSIVYHQPILTNTVFAGIQFLIGFGIVWKRTCKAALALSIVWALGVWWFGEGAGGIFQGTATPFGGGPGGVLFYAVLAVLLWPSEGSNTPFVAARTVGLKAARPSGWRSGVFWRCFRWWDPDVRPRRCTTWWPGLNSGQPGWLAHIDRVSESFFLHHGTPAALLLAVVCLIVAVGVFLPPQIAQVTLVLAIAVFAVIWVAVQNFGGILAGGATDPNSGLLVIVLALTYWPMTTSQSRTGRYCCRTRTSR